MAPIFNYEDKEDTPVVPQGDDLYVPYEKVKDNEFFVMNQETAEILTEMKHQLLLQYPSD